MQKQVYRNDIDDYLVKINLMNARVEGAGALYGEDIRAGRTTEIIIVTAWSGACLKLGSS